MLGISWVARHGVNLFALRLLGSGFSAGTLMVDIAGSFTKVEGHGITNINTDTARAEGWATKAFRLHASCVLFARFRGRLSG